MSSAYLLANTGEGDEVSKLGAEAIELFIVQLDNVNQHPFTVVETQVINDPYGRAGVPIGRVHPQFANLKATGYVIRERIPPLAVKVLVVYKSDDKVGDSGSFNGWKVQSRFTQRVEHIGRSLDERDKTGRIIRAGVLIGPHVYKPLKQIEGPPGPDDLPTHTAIDPATGKEILLRGLGWVSGGAPIQANSVWADNAPIRVTGIDRTITTTDYTLSKTALFYSYSLSRDIDAHGGKVNSISWNGFAAGTLLFDGFTEDELVTSDGFVYSVSIGFSYKKTKWTPVEFVETYTTESGEEAEVVQHVPGDTSAPLETARFKIYEPTNFADLFKLLDGSPSRPRSGRRTLP